MVAARATKPIGARKAQSHPRRGLEALLPRPEAPISVRVDTIKRCRISDFNRDTDHDEPWPEKARSITLPAHASRFRSDRACNDAIITPDSPLRVDAIVSSECHGSLPKKARH